MCHSDGQIAAFQAIVDGWISPVYNRPSARLISMLESWAELPLWTTGTLMHRPNRVIHSPQWHLCTDFKNSVHIEKQGL